MPLHLPPCRPRPTRRWPQVVGILVAIAACASCGAGHPSASARPPGSLPPIFTLSGGHIERHQNGRTPPLPVDVGGQTIRGLSGSGRLGGPLLALTARTGQSDCGLDIRRLSEAGRLGPPLAHGQRPALSPDGRRLGFLESTADPSTGACGGQQLVVLDLPTGRRRSWPTDFHEDGGRWATGPIVTDLTWSPDSRSLAFGSYGDYLIRLDVDTPGPAAAHLLHARHPGLQVPVYVGARSLLVVDTGGAAQGAQSPLLSVSAETGRWRSTVSPDVGDATPVGVEPHTGDLVLATRRDDGSIELSELSPKARTVLFAGRYESIV